MLVEEEEQEAILSFCCMNWIDLPPLLPSNHLFLLKQNSQELIQRNKELKLTLSPLLVSLVKVQNISQSFNKPKEVLSFHHEGIWSINARGPASKVLVWPSSRYVEQKLAAVCLKLGRLGRKNGPSDQRNTKKNSL